jgi:hypothetical protein
VYPATLSASTQRSEKEINMRLRSPRTLAAGATALVLLAGGATALAASASNASGPSTKGSKIERGVLGARVGPDCNMPKPPLGDPLAAAADYVGLSVDQLAQQLDGGKSLADVAKAQGKSVDGLDQALIDAARSELDRSVAAGDITADQEQQVLDQFRSQVDGFVNGSGRLSVQIGNGGLSIAVGGAASDVKLAGGPVETAAGYIGLSVDELTNELQSGKSLAEVATEHGKSVDGLKQSLVAAATAEIEKAVDQIVNHEGLGRPGCGDDLVGPAGIASPILGVGFSVKR